MAEIFPPAIGGSGVLLENVYSRLGVPVRVITEGEEGSEPSGRPGALQIVRTRMRTAGWGVMDPASVWRYARLARKVASSSPAGSLVHCARVIPEGLAALVARREVLCWVHGEELGYAEDSRELGWLVQRVIRAARILVANSEHSRGLLIRRWGASPDRIHVIHPGVDTDRFHPGVDGRMVRDRLARPDDIVLLTVGRLQRRKGQDTVIDAIAHAGDRLARVQYLIVGEGSDRGRLEQLSRDRGVSDRVHFLGAVRDEDLPRYYRAADIFVLPNRTDGADFEGFGIVFLEAAATGLAIVAGRSGGAPEAVGDDDTGVLVPGDDPGSLASALVRLCDDEGLRQRMGNQAMMRVQQRFTWESSAGAFARLLTER